MSKRSKKGVSNTVYPNRKVKGVVSMQREDKVKRIKHFANNLLLKTPNYTNRCQTPIVKIAKSLGFKVYKKKLDTEGYTLEISEKTKKRYGYHKVIMVRRQDDLFAQRMTVAHELGKYLFGSEDDLAGVFATEIMMPEGLFIKQCNIAIAEKRGQAFVVLYLSRYFEVPEETAYQRFCDMKAFYGRRH